MSKVLKNKFLSNVLTIVSFIIFSIICSIILFKSNNIYSGWDIQFHFKRIMELVNSIDNFKSLPNFSFNYFHGSAVMSLYPYINLLPIVFLSFIIKSKFILIYVSFIINTFITFIISYFSSKNYIKYYSTSYIFAIIYSTSSMLLSYNLIMADFGITSSFMFLPLIIFGFLKMIHGNGWMELSIGVALLSMSHVINFIIITIFLLIWFLVNFKYWNKYIIYNLFKSIVLFCIISSIVWLPFFNLYINNLNNIHMPFSIVFSHIKLKMFMSGLYGGKDVNTIGFFPIISLFISIFFYKNFSRYIKQMYLLSLIIILSTLFLPWHFITSFGILTQLQGAYRFLFIPQMLLSFIFSLIVSKYINILYYKKTVFILIIFLSLILQLIVGQYMFLRSEINSLSIDDYLVKNNNVIKFPVNYKFNNNNQFNKLMNSYQNTNDDYIPKSALNMSSYVNHDMGIYNNIHKIQVKHVGYNAFNFFGNNNIKEISLPIYAYNKEKLYVYLNNRLVNNYTNKNGLLTINNVKNNIKINNKIYIKPALDPFRTIGTILSIFGWLFALGIIIKRTLFH